MNSMVERVARAMQSVDDSMNNRMELTDAEAAQLARAAIEAMREPTKEMVEAGYNAIDEAVDYYNYDSGSGYTIEPSGGADVLRAMIDAALNEQVAG